MESGIGRVLVVGAGTNGFATGLSLLDRGFAVEFCDVDPAVRDTLHRRGYECVGAVSAARGPFDLIYLCIRPDEPREDRGHGLLIRAVDDACNLLGRSPGRPVLVVRSTIVPGTMLGKVLPRIRAHLGARSVGVCYQPAFFRERAAVADESHPWVIVAACDAPETVATMQATFNRFDCPAQFVSFGEAELIKYGANLFNATKISFFNLLARHAESLGLGGQIVADGIAAAAEGSWNQAYGTVVGTPFGGKCLPKDLDTFLAFARSAGLDDAGLLESVERINRRVDGRACRAVTGNSGPPG